MNSKFRLGMTIPNALIEAMDPGAKLIAYDAIDAIYN